MSASVHTTHTLSCRSILPHLWGSPLMGTLNPSENTLLCNEAYKGLSRGAYTASSGTAQCLPASLTLHCCLQYGAVLTRDPPSLPRSANHASILASETLDIITNPYISTLLLSFPHLILNISPNYPQLKIARSQNSITDSTIGKKQLSINSSVY